MYNSFLQIKQPMILNENFAIYFRVSTVLNSFGDDQCPGLKLVGDKVNQNFPLLF